MQADLAALALETLDIGLMRVDADLQIVEWTAPAQRFVALPLSVGSNLSEIFPSLNAEEIRLQLLKMLEGRSDRLDQHKIPFRQADNSTIYYALTLVRAIETQNVELLVIVRDVTAEAELEQGIARLQQRLRQNSQP